MRIQCIIFILAVLGGTVTATCAEELESAISKLSTDIAAGVSKSGSKKVSVIDFTDLQGHTSDFGRYLAEQVSVSLVISGKEFSVLDRANMKSILDEHKLTASGLVDPEKARDLGRFSGVDAIVLGSITVLTDSVAVTVKVISTETTQVLAAAKVSISRTKDTNSLLGTPAQSPKSDSPTLPKEPEKKPEPPAKPKPSHVSRFLSVEIDSFQQSGNGCIMLLKITNRSQTNPIRVCINQLASRPQQFPQAVLFDEGNGNALELRAASGISTARSIYGADNSSYEGLKRMAAVASREGNKYGAVRQLFEDLDRNTEIDPAASITCTLQFANQSRSLGASFRLGLELVVAEVAQNERASISLINVSILDIKP